MSACDRVDGTLFKSYILVGVRSYRFVGILQIRFVQHPALPVWYSFKNFKFKVLFRLREAMTRASTVATYNMFDVIANHAHVQGVRRAAGTDDGDA